MEQVLQEFRERISEAAARAAVLRLRGGGSKDWYGQAIEGDVLDTRAYQGIVDYEPTELVITARCGTPLADIEAVLDQQRQMLAFEPPHFGSAATIGGTVAAGLSGPRRAASGAVRDFVLGAMLMDGQGKTLHFGGQVMKNVAGYDVSRLLAGSLGTLGLILEVSLKVLPQPVAETTLAHSATQDEAIRLLNEWGGQALPISASVWIDGVLAVRLSGAQAAVQAAAGRLGGEAIDQGGGLWNQLREQTHPFFQDDGRSLWRLSVPSVTPPIAFPGAQLIEWGGAQRWLRTDADARAVRQAAASAGGHAVLFRAAREEDKAHGVFHPLAPALYTIHRQLKHAFDPAGIFNRGRMYPDL